MFLPLYALYHFRWVCTNGIAHVHKLADFKTSLASLKLRDVAG
jgi:hypothetical protein